MKMPQTKAARVIRNLYSMDRFPTPSEVGAEARNLIRRKEKDSLSGVSEVMYYKLVSTYGDDLEALISL